jgi:hypothetical protein
VLFFVDKDIDDLLSARLRSEHLCYTQYYNVENYIFKYGDIAKGGALASSLEFRVVELGIGDQESWRRKVANNWTEWIAMCLFAAKYDIRCECGFGTHSSINVPVDGSVDSQRRKQVLSMLESRSGLRPDEFSSSFLRMIKQVTTLCASGNHDYIFNGKWYVQLLCARIKVLAGNTPYDGSALNSRLRSTVLSTVDFGAEWATHLIERVSNITGKLTSTDGATAQRHPDTT